MLQYFQKHKVTFVFLWCFEREMLSIGNQGMALREGFGYGLRESVSLKDTRGGVLGFQKPKPVSVSLFFYHLSI